MTLRYGIGAAECGIGAAECGIWWTEYRCIVVGCWIIIT